MFKELVTKDMYKFANKELIRTQTELNKAYSEYDVDSIYILRQKRSNYKKAIEIYEKQKKGKKNETKTYNKSTIKGNSLFERVC